tara:strand:+ start:199 stop:831 length:633 start_codon:yes stop_codon:yes gene_type:complete
MSREFTKRVFSSIILLPLVLFFIIKGSLFFNLFITMCFLFTLYEWHMMSKKKGYNIFGHFFLFFSFYCAYFIRNDIDQSLYVFLMILLICISTDIGGYVFGKILKGPKLTKISPNKTYAGVFGGYFLSLTFVYIFFIYSNQIFNIKNFILIILISTISQLGDITISYFKRLSMIKDTGKLIPGHGGILDRIDGMIFAFPFYFTIDLITSI